MASDRVKEGLKLDWRAYLDIFQKLIWLSFAATVLLRWETGGSLI